MGQPTDFELLPVSDEALQVDLAVILAVGSRHVPVLQGKGAPPSPVERDRLRHDFAGWLVSNLRSYGYRFYRIPPKPLPPSRADQQNQ